jgi:hypothetical protein
MRQVLSVIARELGRRIGNRALALAAAARSWAASFVRNVGCGDPNAMSLGWSLCALPRTPPTAACLPRGSMAESGPMLATAVHGFIPSASTGISQRDHDGIWGPLGPPTA